MKKCLFMIIAVIVIGGLIFTGCSTSTTSTSAAKPANTSAASPATTPAAVTPLYGGVVKIISNPGITSMGFPGKTTFSGEQLLECPAIQFLITRDPKTMAYAGELAESFGYNSDYTAFNIKVRKGVKFHDGTELNAEAVKYNLELVKNGYRAADLKCVTSIDVLDPYTLRLNVTGYVNGFENTLSSMSGGIMSPTYMKSLGPKDEVKPVGTGPYKFVSYQPDVSLKFERFNDYWGGKPYLDGLEWVFVADPVTALASFKAGEADILRQTDVVGATDLGKDGKYSLLKYPQQLWGIAGDGGHADSVYSNLKIRQAVSYAIDTGAITQAIGKGYYATTNQWDKKEGMYYNSNVVGYPYNPQKAKDLLTEAGYPNGFQTKITLPSTVPTPDMMQMVQSYLNAVNIKTTLDVVDPSKYNQASTSGWNNQLMFFWTGAGNGVVDPFKSRMTSVASGYDPKSLCIPADYNAKYQQASTEPDFNKRVAYYQEFLKMATDQYCVATPIMINYYFKAVTSKVHGCDMFDYGINEWRPDKMWLSK
jgi:ABC-type transport system substrate-binding protein